MNINDTQENKEEFCTACVSVPLALAGGGMSVYGSSNSTGKNKKMKKILLITGVVTLVLGLYFLFKKNKSCSTGSCPV